MAQPLAADSAHPPAAPALLPVQEIMATHPEHRRLPHAAEYESGAAYVIDGFQPLDRAGVPIADLGFNRGDAVYDVVSVSRGSFFRLDDHQRRFAASCARMRLTNPFSAAEERAVLNRLVALAGYRDAYVWWGVTRGAMPLRSADRTDPSSFANRFFAYAIPYVFIADDERRSRGADAVVSRNFFRIPPSSVDPRAKNLNGLDFSMALFEAGDRGAEWSLLSDGAGNLTEAPGSNVFVVANGAVATPEDWCLEGITRMTALELVREFGREVEVRKVAVDELMQADEAFLTSSAGGIVPLNSVDGVVLGGGPGPGPLTRALHDRYWQKRWVGWHGTPVDYAAA
ncbi:MAG: aminotransferase class IV [Rhodospirillaceae bacterium]|nr:aminotransferase class IV [Rhodospirillaceae bacterium]